MMRVYSETEGTVKSLEAVVDKALADGKAKCLMIMACDDNGYTKESIDDFLLRLPVSVFGGVFPLVFHGRVPLSKGSVVISMEEEARVDFIPGMSRSDMDFEEVLDEMVQDDDQLQTLMILVDGLSSRIGAFIDALYAVFGLEINYIGGGAGSLSLQQKPCIITNEGLKQDGAVVAALTARSGIGVSHGWTTVSGPYKVTESRGNVIETLDWRPAFEVYREVVEAHSGTKFISRPFFDIAQSYPFGIAKMGTERVVRDPITLDGDRNLICVGEVPVGDYVDILHGQPKTLIEAAGLALTKARRDLPESVRPGLGLIMDCASRMLFLDDAFEDELVAMVPEETLFAGACSLGEIANSGKDYLEFYNKTAVVGFLEDA
ncbi:FIST signal transduction protein [Pseudodesulfovibrio piezophilus]|uniref:Histidine kinase n=1 Tax=Pseudodesulfovibrio piezophilus (strain DSM 21447 / JCM 15486 / C1TLV30) TaxID=1322246 RepID=M1WJY6_PSEP2|nr:FIST C-terminal domain-containing protein [Pseudodesulfovibrio piezophilus]CCH48701.1 conserved protein of unknown function [Pseudodesulfovibrio piezophilus C1TLV30]